MSELLQSEKFSKSRIVVVRVSNKTEELKSIVLYKKDGRRAFMVACSEGHKDVVKLLLASKMIPEEVVNDVDYVSVILRRFSTD